MYHPAKLWPIKKLSWAAIFAVFLVFFGVYSFRLGIKPEFWYDDVEYTYPAFSLAEHIGIGAPLLGTSLDIHKRTYSLIVYYYACVHAVLIRIFGERVESIASPTPSNFALLAAVGTLVLLRRHALVGASVFVYALVRDANMIEAARHGRPERRPAST